MTIQSRTSEQERLTAAREQGVPWRKWGPYLSERQWGTVREDYSDSGNAWDYFSHDQARSRAYRWGEDGLAGISDDRQLLCFALALWNGRDPILKERLFGLTNSEGNHGEDVKEYYFYLDSTPTHSYMKYLYKYPQAEFPYGDLVETNRRRGKHDFEYELLDTGVFDQDRYFDVFVEYAKAAARGPADPDHRSRTAARRRRRSTSCRPSGSATRGRGAATRPGRRSGRRPRAPTAVIAASHPGARRAVSRLRGRDRALVHRERDEQRAALPGRPTAPRTSRTGSTSISSTAAGRQSTPPRRGRRPPRIISSPWRPAPPQTLRLRLSDVAPGGAGGAERRTGGAVQPRFRRDDGHSAGRKPTSSTPRSSRHRSTPIRPT